MLVLPNKSAVVWERFLKENEILVYKYIVREIKKKLSDTTSERIELFKFEDNSMFAWIPKNKMLDTLEQAMKIFVKAEEYEYAQKTKEVINSCHINRLIKESTQLEG